MPRVRAGQGGAAPRTASRSSSSIMARTLRNRSRRSICTGRASALGTLQDRQYAGQCRWLHSASRAQGLRDAWPSRQLGEAKPAWRTLPKRC